MLLCGGNVMTLRQILDNLFSHPPAIEDLSFTVRKTPLEIGHGAGVCTLLTEVVRIGKVNLVVGTS